MDDFKKQLQQRLIANTIIDKCAHNDALIFRDSWCSQERVLRFTTPFFRTLFGVSESSAGKWKTGDLVMYEVNNGLDSFVVNCVMSVAPSRYPSYAVRKSIISALELSVAPGIRDVVLKSWDLSADLSDVNKLFTAFDRLTELEIPCFEQELGEAIAAAKDDAQELKEGAVSYVVLNKYERNPKARAECIAAHGAVCAVCGMEFEKVYGPEFAGIIEVHHIVPISKIGREYVVDPVNDLVPVCSNCHTALHHKKDGVYTVEELIAMKNRQS